MTKTNGNRGGGTSIHISLQVEGGVGKSSIDALLSRYFRELGCVQRRDADDGPGHGTRDEVERSS